MKFESNPYGTNEILTVDEDVYISYNARPGGGFSMFESDNGGSETAIVIDGKFYILNGDYRERYEAAIAQGGMPDVLKIYASEAEDNGSSWTTASDPIKFLERLVERVS